MKIFQIFFKKNPERLKKIRFLKRKTVDLSGKVDKKQKKRYNKSQEKPPRERKMDESYGKEIDLFRLRGDYAS